MACVAPHPFGPVIYQDLSNLGHAIAGWTLTIVSTIGLGTIFLSLGGRNFKDSFHRFIFNLVLVILGVFFAIWTPIQYRNNGVVDFWDFVWSDIAEFSYLVIFSGLFAAGLIDLVRDGRGAWLSLLGPAVLFNSALIFLIYPSVNFDIDVIHQWIAYSTIVAAGSLALYYQQFRYRGQSQLHLVSKNWVPNILLFLFYLGILASGILLLTYEEALLRPCMVAVVDSPNAPLTLFAIGFQILALLALAVQVIILISARSGGRGQRARIVRRPKELYREVNVIPGESLEVIRTRNTGRPPFDNNE